jgi:hypothetical protein
MILHSEGLNKNDFTDIETFARVHGAMVGLSVRDVNGRSIGRIQRLDTETMEMDVVLMDYTGFAYYTKDECGTAVPVTVTVAIPDATMWTYPTKRVLDEESGLSFITSDTNQPEYQLTHDLFPVTVAEPVIVVEQVQE